jgi:hypothetical protein
MYTIAHFVIYAVLDEGLELIIFIAWNAIAAWGLNRHLINAWRKV